MLANLAREERKKTKDEFNRKGKAFLEEFCFRLMQKNLCTHKDIEGIPDDLMYS